MVPSAIFLNEGSLNFQDVSDKSIPDLNSWVHGATVCDINQDGWPDLYLCVGGPKQADTSPINLLLVNLGLGTENVPVFEEQAELYGLADSSFSIHAAFLDYDLDDDLDLFIGTNEVNAVEKTLIIPSHVQITEGRTIDRLYENVGDRFNQGVPYYELKDTSFGINQEGYCLGVTIEDVNGDGWADIYVANDFMPNDLLYLNQSGKGFKNSAQDLLPSQSLNGMGVAITDINQDLTPDIFVLDMLPDNSDRKKSMISHMENQTFNKKVDAGFNSEYIRNTLQLNLGAAPHTSQILFSEIGQVLGIHATDWSWCPVFADFDQDGLKDLFISNGFVKDMTDLDYINYDSYQASFGETKQDKNENKIKLLNALKEVKISNYLFRNEGDLHFQDITNKSGVYHPSFSNAVISEDLDGDGDLDIATNDLNGHPLVYENDLTSLGKQLQLDIQYREPNRWGIGTKIYWKDGSHQGYHYINPTSGYLSSTLGKVFISAPHNMSPSIEEIKIIWPNGCANIYEDVPSAQTLEINYSVCQDTVKKIAIQPLLQRAMNLDSVVHIENPFNDFDHHPLWIRKYSTEGPAFGLGELDQQTGMDAIMGGSSGNPALGVYQIDGSTQIDTLWDLEARYEDVDIAIFDYDLDGLLDVYMVSGGVEYAQEKDLLQDRLYKNLGDRQFKKMEVLPMMSTSGSVVRPCDYDQDGDEDLFVGGRIEKDRFPHPPPSYILQNNIDSFIIIESAATEHLGMITDARWSDLDSDGWLDLICVGEFMSPTILKNTQGKLTLLPMPSLQEHVGLWESLTVGDVDNDGDIDLIAGNIGLNQDYKATTNRPFMLYADDFDNNGHIDPVFAYHQKSSIEGGFALFPFHGMDDLVKGILSLRKRFYRYDVFSKSTLKEVIGEQRLDTCTRFSATQFASGVFLNHDDHFTFIPFPRLAQSAPLSAIVQQDLNHDQHIDLLIGGNANRFENTYGSRDNSPGWMLLGNGDGTFKTTLPAQSGFAVTSDLRAIQTIPSKDSEKLILCIGNDSEINVFRTW